MRQSNTGDLVAMHLAYVASRALYLDSQLREQGPHRGRERELASTRWLMEQLSERYPASVDEAWELAQEHMQYMAERRAAWSKVTGR